MTKRQIRELMIALAVLLLGIAAGWAYRTYTSADGKEEAAMPPTGKAAPASAKPQNPNEVVARLNGQEITRGEVEKYYRVNMALEEIDEAAVQEETKLQVRRSALQQIIDERLLLEAAPKSGVTITDQEIEGYIKATVLRDFEDQAELEESLKNDLGLTYAELKDMLMRQELAIKMRDKLAEKITVTDKELDEEVKAYREVMKKHPGGPVDDLTRDELRQELLDKKAMREYSVWLDALATKAKIEILDPSLKEGPVELIPQESSSSGDESAEKQKNKGLKPDGNG